MKRLRLPSRGGIIALAIALMVVVGGLVAATAGRDPLIDLRGASRSPSPAAIDPDFRPGPLPRYAAALKARAAGIRDVKILCIGDSTTQGFGGAGGTGDDWERSYPTVLATLLQRSVPSARGLSVPQNNPDSRWTTSGAWYFHGGAVGWGRNSSYESPRSSRGSLSWRDPGVRADRFDIWFLGHDGDNGPFRVQIDDEPPVLVRDTDRGDGGWVRATVSAARVAAGHRITVTNPRKAFVAIEGIDAWRSDLRQVRVGNAGNGGSTSGAWADVGGEGQYQSIPGIRAYAPDLTIISLGINDALVQPTVSAAEYRANIQDLVAAARLSGDVVLMPPMLPKASIGAGTIPLEREYAARLRTLRLPWADIQRRQGDGDSAAERGLLFDDVHRSAAGYADVARMLAGPLAGIAR